MLPMLRAASGRGHPHPAPRSSARFPASPQRTRVCTVAGSSVLMSRFIAQSARIGPSSRTQPRPKSSSGRIMILSTKPGWPSSDRPATRLWKPRCCLTLSTSFRIRSRKARVEAASTSPCIRSPKASVARTTRSVAALCSIGSSLATRWPASVVGRKRRRAHATLGPRNLSTYVE